MASTPTRTRMTAEQFFREYPDDGNRYELVDGELREMTTPNIRHQRIETGLFRLLDNEVLRIGGEIFRSVGVIVADDTVQVPDLVILTQRVQQSDLEYGLVAPPDLVIEILSRSTGRYDRTVKADRYAALGVREMWLVSPEAESIEIFTLVEGRYTLHARVGLDEPVSSVVLPGLSFPTSAAFAD